jgi:hypothetical protein
MRGPISQVSAIMAKEIKLSSHPIHSLKNTKCWEKFLEQTCWPLKTKYNVIWPNTARVCVLVVLVCVHSTFSHVFVQYIPPRCRHGTFDHR